MKSAIYEVIIFGNASIDPPMWTIKIEFIGSIYVLLFYISKPKSTLIMPGIMVLFLIYTLHQQESIYYFAFFAGSLLNHVKKITKYNILIFFLGIYLGGFQFNSLFYDYLPNLTLLDIVIWEKKNFYNAVGAVLVTLSVSQGLGSKIFEGRLFKFLGKISFSIYLTHFFVLCSFSSLIYIFLPQSKFYLGLNFLLYVMMCFVIALIFEKFIDRKAIEISHYFTFKMFS